MDDPSFDIEELLFKALQGTLSTEEEALLEAWKAEKPGNHAFAEQLLHPDRLTGKLRLYAAHNQQQAREEAIRHLFPQQRTKTMPLLRWWVAAAMLILVAGSIYVLISYRIPVDAPVKISRVPAMVAPGRPGAVLTLGNGSQVLLDTVKNGVVALQDGVTARIINGVLHYEGVGAGMVYNTMSTPKGRLFELTLPDGTQVWLNSASSIRYPVAFNGVDRKVEITGEAYFEVAANVRKPFRVTVNNSTEVQVLGTHFNVNAYSNEQQAAATLLEGAIQVQQLNTGNHAVKVQPGQQAVWQADESAAGVQLVKSVDIEKVMAWKNGLFNFEGASLEEVMRQLERWYDIEVVFEKPMTDIRFGGKMTKGIPLNDLLEGLKGVEGYDLKFRMEGKRTLVVSR
ncbi:FecR family protein [Filimonas lacunae]|uniref:FecR family protein n=1 Tax=Filimonas lacunae TaxID=477680 RepID=A0A173MI35_9BACT|nr:FecR family protein [Filimonas lacunae]BAV07081.1 anti-sigma factor [Filimonas lacunae]SIS95260.1 FecR family protein [Filimonas lacunae]